MPIIESAKKAYRASLKKKVTNDRVRRTLKDSIKEVGKLIKSGKKDEALKMLPLAYKAIDKASKRGVIKSNTADRKKSRLTKTVNKA